MKVIDLLNKIANGEEVVAKHRLFDLEFDNIKEFKIGYPKGLDRFSLFDIIKILNDEVEIIEEDKKIEQINKIYDLTDFHKEYPKVAEMMKEIGDKQREIIDYLNKENK